MCVDGQVAETARYHHNTASRFGILLDDSDEQTRAAATAQGPDLLQTQEKGRYTSRPALPSQRDLILLHPTRHARKCGPYKKREPISKLPNTPKSSRLTSTVQKG